MQLGSVLKQIIKDKKKLVEESKNKVSLQELKIKTTEISKPIDFKNIFDSNEISLIAEIKRSSASAGDILPELDLSNITNTYIEGGVSAISILTEKTRFGGSLSDLKEVASICKKNNVPVLQKDFIFDVYQIYEGALNGASAALIIVSISYEKHGS